MNKRFTADQARGMGKERRMCKYCEFEHGTAKEPFYKGHDGYAIGYLDLYKEGPAIVLDKDPYSQWDTGDTFIMGVNNCPMCGRDLTKERLA